jgi:5'-deoxynucleotidase YfbR-like HD superfamily hydrolase
MSAATILTLANLRGIDLRNPKASDIDFDSFAEHLAKENRFNGATPGLVYSVAEHLARGVDAILAAMGDHTLAAYFSLHDGHEAVLKDMTTPLKRAIAEECKEKFGVLAEHVLCAINNLEYRHDVAIHEAAGLTWPMAPPTQLLVKHWDLVMFVTEWRDLMQSATHPRPQDYAGLDPIKETIIPWHWQTAKRALLNRWKRLLPSLQGKIPENQEAQSSAQLPGALPLHGEGR